MNAPVRRLTWDEDNRLKAVCTGRRLGCYTYDAGGERTYKVEADYLELDINGQVYWQGYQSDRQTLYTSPYLVFNNQGYTKHYYAGDQRVASVIGGGLANAPQPLFTNPVFGFEIASIDDYKAKRTENELMMLRDMQNIQLPDNLIFSNFLSSQIMQQNVANNPENLIYYYHPDHLGSASFISDASGLATQHLEYFPFGETFVEENVGSFFTRYKFNAKEQDSESDLYYYGARYYDPKTSVWLGVDPLSDQNPHESPFVFCRNNPVLMVDPDGRNADKYYNEEGTCLLDTKVGDKVFVIKTSKTYGQIHGTNKYGASINGISTTEAANTEQEILNGNLSSVNQNNLIELPAADTRENMLNVVASDDGTGGNMNDNPNNFKEHGGTLDVLGGVVRDISGIKKDPSKAKEGDPAANINFVGSLNYKGGARMTESVFHSHPSGMVGVSSFLQSPSIYDQNEVFSANSYVFGRANKMVYIYNNKGIIGTIPQKVFQR